jgi:hypothetical protein
MRIDMTPAECLRAHPAGKRMHDDTIFRIS